MEKLEFDELFKKIVVEPLTEKGFKTSGKSVYFLDDAINVSLIRLGGRKAMSGSIAHILCFRHSYLPNLKEQIPEKFESEVFSYPLKLSPRAALGHITYQPKNLNYDHSILKYEDKTEESVIKELETLKECVLALLKWANSCDPIEFAEKIKDKGSNAWIERIWLEAYETNRKNI